MAQANRYRLKLSKLDFVSLVDNPAQPNATTLLIKRDQRVSVGQRADHVEATARYVKASDELGLAFFWAFTSKVDGADHFDLQGDTVDEDFIKAAMEFMEGGGAVDEMHDYEATKARVVFAMPMTPEIAKAYGIETSTTGLMVAIKCAPEQLAKLKDGTYTGVSIAGLGTREPIAAKRAPVKKQVSLYTDEVEGHQHQIDICEDGSIWCSWATAADAENSHAHAVSRDESGALIILADSGHTHGLAEGQPAVVVVPEGAVVVTSVEMRAPTTNRAAAKARAGESTRLAARPNVNPQAENLMIKANEPDANAEKIATLEKRNTHLERIAKLSGAHKAHYDSLAGDAQEQFLAKNEIERDQAIELAEKADPIEFTLDGVDYRKSTQGYSLAKRLRDEVEKNERIEIEKAAKETVGGMPGDDATHAALIKAVRKSGESAEMQAKMIEALKGANAIVKSRAVAPGSDGEANGQRGDAGGDPKTQLEKGLVAFCKANSIDLSTKWTVGLPRFEATEEGASLKRAYDESRVAG